MSAFFAVGAAISAVSLLALLFPGGPLEPMWKLNPRAHDQFQVMGRWAFPLMAIVSAACTTASIGLWRGRRLGYLLGITLLVVSLLGDLANALLRLEPRAWVGVPVAIALIGALSRGSSRAFFERGSNGA